VIVLKAAVVLEAVRLLASAPS